MLTVPRAFELFEEAATCEDAERCVGIYESVLELQRLRGDLAHAGATITVGATLRNLAGMMQELRRFGRMRDLTAELCALDADEAQHRMLHAIALKHTGDAASALAEIRRAVALEPTAPDPHHELACQLLAGGDVDGAIASIAQAMACGADPGVLAIDDELAPLRADPRWPEAVSQQKYVDGLVATVMAVHLMFVATMPEPSGDEAEDEAAGVAWLGDALVIDLLEQARTAFERLFAVEGALRARAVEAARDAQAFWLVNELATLFRSHGVTPRDM